MTFTVRLVMSLLLCLTVPFSAWGSALGTAHHDVSPTASAQQGKLNGHDAKAHCHPTSHKHGTVAAVKTIAHHHGKCFCGCGVNACTGASAIGQNNLNEPSARIVATPVLLLVSSPLSPAHNASLLRPPRFLS